MNNALLLLLLDSQAPAGAHHHSAGMEAAITAGLVTDLAGTEDFCQPRLRTSARVAASFAAASGRLFSAERADLDSSLPAELAVLDAEYEARVPSEATRRASRELGPGLWRLLRSVLRETDLVTAFSRCACAGPASAAVRLLGLDPFAVHAMLARLAPDVDACAAAAARAACLPPASLPAHGAPALDLLADYHLTAEVRLFAS
jgi:urease accessory protein